MFSASLVSKYDFAQYTKKMPTNMLEEQRKQGVRLEKLEMEPGETHKQIRMSVITTVIGAIVGAAVGAVLMIL